MNLNEKKFTQPPFDLSGFLVVNKPEGLTSMDVIRVIRRICRPKKIGHGGTLDPFAKGVLPILMNQATRLSEEVMSGIKEYEGSFVLGLTYDTQDMTGHLMDSKEVPENLTLEKLQAVARQFIGAIEQTPPLYSAVKKKGVPLYEYARQGVAVEVSSRRVFVEKFSILSSLGENRFQFYVRCAKGVYVRTLIHDFGGALDVGAVVEKLTRTQTGRFHLDEAVELSTLKDVSDIKAHLKPLTVIS